MNPKKVDMPTMSIDKYKDMKVMNKKFLTIREGVELYSMGHENLRKMAEEAGAIYKINRKILINAAVLYQVNKSHLDKTALG